MHQQARLHDDVVVAVVPVVKMAADLKMVLVVLVALEEQVPAVVQAEDAQKFELVQAEPLLLWSLHSQMIECHSLVSYRSVVLETEQYLSEVLVQLATLERP